MPVESATYIHDLNSANPAGSDPVSDGATHLRLVKSVLQSTFPNATSAVSATSHQMNQFVPIGGIIIWYSTIATIPAGWVLCAGQTVSRTDGGGNITAPNLLTRFPVCANYDSGAPAGNYNVGDTGGSTTPSGTAATAGSHSHGGVTGGPTLVDAADSGTGGSFSFATAIHAHAISSDGSHTHSVAISDGRPPYAAYPFIMRI
jgi:hypothetical protein